MEIRSFLAFELPTDIKKIVEGVSKEMRKASLKAKWVKVENIHLTVVFMGNIEAQDVKAIGEETRSICSRFNPFDISLNGVGVFPGLKAPRVLWIGLKGDLERMSQFRDALHQSLRSFGVKEEKRGFKPHLTLARFNHSRGQVFQPGDLLSGYQDLESPVCSLRELVFIKSDLKPGGAVYTKMDTLPLAGPM
jgi:RNA 2',3'-cyclic 3'-phosphodiesterase